MNLKKKKRELETENYQIDDINFQLLKNANQSISYKGCEAKFIKHNWKFSTFFD